MPIFKSTKPSQQSPQPPPTESTRSIPEEPHRNRLLARLRNLQLTRPNPVPEILPDTDPEPVDPQQAEKAARREARREKRRKREEEWNEEFRQRRNYAIEIGVEMRPLTPLSDFDSASEDERQPVSEKPPPAKTYAPVQHNQDNSLVGEGLHPPTSPSLSLHHSQSSQPHTQHDQPLQDNPQPTEAPPPPHDPKEDAQLAEMFAAQAFAAPSLRSPPPQNYQHTSYAAPQPHQAQPQPSPIGWGGVYHSVPSQPMYGTPAHLTPVPRTLRDIDPILAENIRRGRELAMLAIEQEERGNLGAAEAGYIKALALLVPASKQLDVGTELNKNARMQQKAKIQREAAAMLDRCEELRMFLRANGPSVPSEMPVMPGEATRKRPTSSLKKQSSLGDPPSRNLPPTPKTQPSAPPPSQSHITSDRSHTLPLPPPPPQLPESHGRSHLLNRLNSRRDVLASASTIIPPDASRQMPPDASRQMPPDASREVPPDASRHMLLGPDASRQIPPSDPPRMESQRRRAPRTDEKCFMCSAPAQLQTRCGHTYCSNCGNQAVSVFGQCPVPDCGARIAVEDFKHIL